MRRVISALAGAAAFVIASPLAAFAGPSLSDVTVSPSTGLFDGQSVTVTATPLADPRVFAVAAQECGGFYAASRVCDPVVTLPIDGTQASGKITVHRTLVGSQATWRCGIDGPCDITVSQVWFDGTTMHVDVHAVELGFAPK
jgi:hypothetical protein